MRHSEPRPVRLPRAATTRRTPHGSGSYIPDGYVVDIMANSCGYSFVIDTVDFGDMEHACRAYNRAYSFLWPLEHNQGSTWFFYPGNVRPGTV